MIKVDIFCMPHTCHTLQLIQINVSENRFSCVFVKNYSILEHPVSIQNLLTDLYLLMESLGPVLKLRKRLSYPRAGPNPYRGHIMFNLTFSYLKAFRNP